MALIMKHSQEEPSIFGKSPYVEEVAGASSSPSWGGLSAFLCDSLYRETLGQEETPHVPLILNTIDNKTMKLLHGNARKPTRQTMVWVVASS